MKNTYPNMLVFLTGELTRESKTYMVEVVVELHDNKDQLNERYTTDYSCRPKEFDMLLNVFPLVDRAEEKIKVDVTTEDFQQLYKIDKTGTPKDIHLNMSIESGVSSLFSSKSSVTLRNRSITLENGKIHIRREAVLEAYIMDVRVKTLNYSIEEWLTEGYVLQQQKFTEPNGAYFAMDYPMVDEPNNKPTITIQKYHTK